MVFVVLKKQYWARSVCNFVISEGGLVGVSSVITLITLHSKRSLAPIVVGKALLSLLVERVDQRLVYGFLSSEDPELGGFVLSFTSVNQRVSVVVGIHD